MKTFKGTVENITHKVTVDGVTYTTPVYDVEYTCKFSSNGTFLLLRCNKHKGVKTIPHKYTGGGMCTGKDFKRIVNEAYPNKELIHLVCERFFRQYNEVDQWGTPRVLKMCWFWIYHRSVDESNFDQLLSKYEYYFFHYSDPILKLTHDCRGKLIGRNVYFIKRK